MCALQREFQWSECRGCGGEGADGAGGSISAKQRMGREINLPVVAAQMLWKLDGREATGWKEHSELLWVSQCNCFSNHGWLFTLWLF